MTSFVGMASAASVSLGGEAITSFTDPLEPAKILAPIYEDLRDEVIRDGGGWNCANARAMLSPLSAEPAFGWDYQFTLPTDPYCLFVRKLLETGQDDNDTGFKFKVEGRKLLANISPAYILYSKRITDPNDFDANLKQVYINRLRCALAMPLTRSRTMEEQCWGIYNKMIENAQTINSLEGREDEKIWPEDLFDARIR